MPPIYSQVAAKTPAVLGAGESLKLNVTLMANSSDLMLAAALRVRTSLFSDVLLYEFNAYNGKLDYVVGDVSLLESFLFGRRLT